MSNIVATLKPLAEKSMFELSYSNLLAGYVISQKSTHHTYLFTLIEATLFFSRQSSIHFAISIGWPLQIPPQIASNKHSRKMNFILWKWKIFDFGPELFAWIFYWLKWIVLVKNNVCTWNERTGSSWILLTVYRIYRNWTLCIR